MRAARKIDLFICEAWEYEKDTKKQLIWGIILNSKCPYKSFSWFLSDDIIIRVIPSLILGKKSCIYYFRLEIPADV